MYLPEEAQQIIQNSPYQKVVKQIVTLALDECSTYQITPTDIQLTVLVNHLNEMIKRSQENEKIMEVDVAMFTEVSKEAIDISKKIVNTIGNLQVDEVYVLSIHFETAKQN